MGTPDFSGKIFSSLLDAGYHIVAAYTKPDRESGRDRKIVPSPVKQIALTRGIPVEQPSRFDTDVIATLRGYKPDLIIVAAYGKILPKAVLDLPGFGCVNVHASLLPRWRGASPIQNALLAGDTETGVTIMLMDEGIDTGDILSAKKTAISFDDTNRTLLEKLAGVGTEILSETLPGWVERYIEPKAQDGSQATVCQLIEREDGRIFWNSTALEIWNRYRGLTPWPGIFSFWKQKDEGFIRLKLTRISIQRTDPAVRREFGEVFESGEKIAIQTGEGLIFVEEIQAEGKSPMPIRDFLNGRPDLIGSVLG
ncbi:MAG: methionyl-tRNA formyltransferase [Candidatus Moranbacteria bacterium]|nr:methionyl-tRNA formyltransferase [Candidatus Moranbacteria bacterium]